MYKTIITFVKGSVSTKMYCIRKAWGGGERWGRRADVKGGEEA